MCGVLARYRDYLKPIRQRPSTGATDLAMLFNVDAFIEKNAANSRTAKEFYHQMTATQENYRNFIFQKMKFSSILV